MFCNQALLFSERMYHTLGVGLWIVKTRSPLKRLLKLPSTFTRGQVASPAPTRRAMGCGSQDNVCRWSVTGRVGPSQLVSHRTLRLPAHPYTKTSFASPDMPQRQSPPPLQAQHSRCNRPALQV